MKKYVYILPKIFLTFFFIFLVGVDNTLAQVSGDFPYFESFLSDTQPTGIIKPPAGGGFTNSAEFTDNGVLLTTNEFNKFGAVYLNNHQFDANAGIYLSFEYMIYGGTGGDGLSVFFFDATKDPGIGSPGAGIGYTYNRAHTSFANKRVSGVNGAYLGVAFDSYGNFKKMFYQGEARVNGLPYNFGVTGTSLLNTTPTDNDVVLRGAMSPTGVSGQSGMSVGYTGYPVLVTQSTTQNIGHRLKEGASGSTNSADFAWEQYNQLKVPNTFTIRGGTEFERPTDQGYRRAYVELFPNNETGEGGFFVSVMIEHDNRKDTVIYDYVYRESFTYLENAYPGDNNSSNAYPTTPSPRKVLDATVPAALKIGFAAATGDSGASGGMNDNHVIKNLKLTLPRAAEAYDDFLDDEYQGTTVTFYPLLNDFGYTGTIAREQAQCPECIDETTFRFVLDDGTIIYDDSENIIEYTALNEGKWSYNKMTGIVTFQPLSSFLGEARIMYDIKGGKGNGGNEIPYSLEAYRSAPATIGVNIIVNPNPSRMIITNKMVTGKFRN